MIEDIFTQAGGASLTSPEKMGKEKKMHEEVNQRVVSLSIRAGKLTTDVLAKAVRMYLEAQKRSSYKKPPQIKHGQMTVKQLMEQNAGATNYELDPNNIKGFVRVERKYHVDFAVKKNNTLDPPKYIVFFKSRDQDTMDKALQEFSNRNNNTKKREPFKQVLQKFKELSVSLDKNREREKTKQRNLEQSL